MGMFDYVRSSYDLGEQFTNVECQTKDIEEYGIGGTMSHYWLDPHGYLYYIDYWQTADFVELKEGDEGYSEIGFLNFIWRPNGNHGKVTPWYLTKYIEVYPSDWKGEWKDWPRLRLHFRCGKLVDYEDVTGR
jgi:hypothetical protein